MTAIDKLAWIEIKNNAVLLTKSFGKDKFYIPGGKREKRETDQEALCREIHEELDITIKPNTLKFIGVFEAQAHAQAIGVLVKMTCYQGEYSGIPTASSEIETLKWFKYTDKHELVGVDVLIFEHLFKEGLII
jgi:8-oxo-dGTP diphosphatase